MATVQEAPASLSTWMTRSRAWMSILLLAPAAIGAICSVPHLPAESWGHMLCEAIGYSIFMLGAALRWWATLYIGGRKTYELVCHGPYSICRNPLYVGTWLMAISVACLIQSLVFGIALLAVSVFYLGITVPNEERRLARDYPGKFDKYCARVPRFLPRFSSYQSPEFIEVRLVGLRAELIRTLRWVWIPAVCSLTCHLRFQDWWPHWTNWP